MSEITITFGVLTVILILGWLTTIILLIREKKDLQRQWQKERSELLDRIQAPSFAEYKHAEVRTIKAQQEKKEEPKLEIQ